MYPQRELDELALSKAALRCRIAEHRAACLEHAEVVLRPVGWLDTALDFWRQISPLGKLLAIPLGLFTARVVRRNAAPVGRWLHWGSLVFSAVRQFTGR